MIKKPKKHLAIFTPPFLDLILEGKKTIEARFSKVRCAPYGVVNEGDIVFMKDSGGPIRGSFQISKLEQFKNIKLNDLKKIERKNKIALCSDVDPNYWTKRQECKYATLMHVTKPACLIKSYSINKNDRRGWVVINTDKDSSKQLSFFPYSSDIKKAFDPLKSSCSEGLHTFFRSKQYNPQGNPKCKWCGSDCVDWSFLHKKDSNNIRMVIYELRKEFWRNSWFQKKIEYSEIEKIEKKGLEKLKVNIEKRIINSVGNENPYRDGYQTPYTGNIIFYAQHATATCCRKCIETWHGIPQGKKLSEEDIVYLSQLVLQFIRFKVPNL